MPCRDWGKSQLTGISLLAHAFRSGQVTIGAVFVTCLDFFHYLRMMADYYRHFKGGKYKLLGIAKDSETLEKMVVYQALYGEGDLWVRPYEMFFGTVERDGKVIQRFTKISEEEAL